MTIHFLSLAPLAAKSRDELLERYFSMLDSYPQLRTNTR